MKMKMNVPSILFVYYAKTTKEHVGCLSLSSIINNVKVGDENEGNIII